MGEQKWKEHFKLLSAKRGEKKKQMKHISMLLMSAADNVELFAFLWIFKQRK